MPKRKQGPKEPTPAQDQLSLSLKLETADKSKPNVDVDDFLGTAEKWLRALKTFAKEQGEHVKWEIVDLRKSSALIQVQPVRIGTGKPVPKLVRKWDSGLRQMEETGRPVSTFSPEAMSDLYAFIIGVPSDTVVSVGNGTSRLPITSYTQHAIEAAVRHLPEQPRAEYLAQGSIRGRLAVLDSWNPEDRSFRLQLPLNPTKPVKCTYRDVSLVSALGVGFEGMVEITGKLKYKPEHPWPFAADVDHIRVLPRKPAVGLNELVGLVHLPEGQDSLSYVRSLRDAE
jgi:hypothetical protein